MHWSEAARNRAVVDALRAWARDIESVPRAAGLDIEKLLARWYDSESPEARPAMSMVVTATAEVTTVAVTGDIDLAGSDRLRRRLADELELAPHALLLDLTEVGHCSARGLSVLLETTTEARGDDVPFAIVGAAPVIRQAITVLRLDQVLPVHATMTDAVDWLLLLARLKASH